MKTLIQNYPKTSKALRDGILSFSLIVLSLGIVKPALTPVILQAMYPMHFIGFA